MLGLIQILNKKKHSLHSHSIEWECFLIHLNLRYKIFKISKEKFAKRLMANIK